MASMFSGSETAILVSGYAPRLEIAFGRFTFGESPCLPEICHELLQTFEAKRTLIQLGAVESLAKAPMREGNVSKLVPS
jgi:hypothetical protein